jgi:hypothetical protein
LIVVDHLEDGCHLVNVVMTLRHGVIDDLDQVMCALSIDISQIMIGDKPTEGDLGLIVGIVIMSDDVQQAAVKGCLNAVVQGVEMTEENNDQDQMTVIEHTVATVHQDAATLVHHLKTAVHGLLITDDRDLNPDPPAGLEIDQRESMRYDARGRDHQENAVKVVVTETKERQRGP